MLASWSLSRPAPRRPFWAHTHKERWAGLFSPSGSAVMGSCEQPEVP